MKHNNFIKQIKFMTTLLEHYNIIFVKVEVKLKNRKLDFSFSFFMSVNENEKDFGIQNK